MVVNEDGSLERGTATTPYVVGDGSGALNVIVDSGAVTVSDGSGSLNTIVDSGTITVGRLPPFVLSTQACTSAKPLSVSTTDPDSERLITPLS